MANKTVDDIRNDFPALSGKMNDRPLIYLDNAATTHKPQAVIDAINEFYSHSYATVHRGVYERSVTATERCEEVRKKVQRFINAKSETEIVFCKGTTEAINLIAHSLGRQLIQSGDRILISEIEHHANIVPWVTLCKEKDAILEVIPVKDNGELDQTAYKNALKNNPKLVAIGHISNALGTVNPIKSMIADAHKVGAKVIIDGAQSIQHVAIDVQDLDCDFFCFSGHKLYGPTGIGVLYGKKAILDEMTPYQGGGDMIETVRFDRITYAPTPNKFEAGTPPITQTIGLGPAIDYILSIGLEHIANTEAELLEYATQQLNSVPGLSIIGTAPDKASVISFEIQDIHPHDIGTILDQEGIAIRAGHHCAQPTMKRFGVPATARASFSFYNTHDEIDALKTALIKVRELLL